MFPVEFARETIGALSRPGDTVLDPFCGRGTAPYVAMISGRGAVGCDVNPVAWLYASVKTDPHPSLADVQHRIEEVAVAVRPHDRLPANEFQALAYAPNALGFINAARRVLQWRESRLDRTVAAFLLQHLHAKLGQGLSNQMRPSRAMCPDYSVRWWRARGLTTPPDVDAASFLAERAAWRYAKGVPERAGNARLSLGDATDALPDGEAEAALVLTSPPYAGVTNYRSDNWLRLWALGEGPPRVDWSTSQKFTNPEKYETMLNSVMQSARDRARSDAIWYLRVDARERTLAVARRIMGALLPAHRRYERPSSPPRRTQTALYGDHRVKPGDVDLVYVPRNRRKPALLRSFSLARVARG
ncbi:MAG: DNA methyltransferase [Chloroflexi bacterium]|nr:DNA methyltransferase [Chloroflexota bacterium]